MFRALLGLEPGQEIVGLSFRGGWLWALLLIAGAIAFSIFLYRSERRLALKRRVIMTVCQALALLILILVILQPYVDVRSTKTSKRNILVLLDTSRSMAIEDPRSTPEEVSDAAVALGKIQGGSGSLDPTLTTSLQAEIGDVSRFDLARAALDNGDINLRKKLGENYNLRFFSFDSQLMPADGESDDSWGANLKPEGDSSQVGTAIDEAVARFVGQPVSGAIVLSDFNWIEGKDPSAVAKALKARGIPAYPVPIGVPAPPDVMVRDVIAPEFVFKGDRVPLRVKLESRGFDGRGIELVLKINDQRLTSKQIELRGGTQFEEMMFIPEDRTGSVDLEFLAEPITSETSRANNSTTHQVKIIDEKIKVLYVEGMPRWEYRYLRWVLLRDQRLDVTFLMTQGDPALANSNQHIGRFPQETKDIRKYDLIIIGDVPASYFNSAQMGEIQSQIKAGGSLLMLAGPMAAPNTYRDTPIEKILPVVLGSGGWQGIGSNVTPVVTPAGRDSLVTSLSLSPEQSDRIWSHVRPMYRLPQLGGAKSGATVLLSLPKASEDLPDYPLVAWHRYHKGRSMFVGTEDLWRMRREVGDRYHARFWGQAIQFLTLSQMLDHNKPITLEADRSNYSGGEQVRVFANVLTESFDPVLRSSYEVEIEQKDTPDTGVILELSPVPGSPGLYSGSHLASKDATYTISSTGANEEYSNEFEYNVATEPLEDRETAVLEDVARQIAEISGGKKLTLSQLATLPDEIGDQGLLHNVVRSERDLWDAPIWFLLIVLFAGAEWYLRRKDNLV